MENDAFHSKSVIFNAEENCNESETNGRLAHLESNGKLVGTWNISWCHFTTFIFGNDTHTYTHARKLFIWIVRSFIRSTFLGVSFACMTICFVCTWKKNVNTFMLLSSSPLSINFPTFDGVAHAHGGFDCKFCRTTHVRGEEIFLNMHKPGEQSERGHTLQFRLQKVMVQS